MFGERLKRIVAIILIFGMVATGNGFTTFAASVDSIVEGSDTLDQTGPKNYYQMIYPNVKNVLLVMNLILMQHNVS